MCKKVKEKQNHSWHGLMLLWFTDLMNVTEEVTIHRPNFYFKEKVSLSGPSEKQKTPQDLEYK